VAKYNLTKVSPDGMIHHHAFDEIRDSLAWALSSLGHEVSITENWFSEHGETNIVFGCELIADFQRLPRNTIIYQLEQFSHPRIEQVKRLTKAVTVWDFSHRQSVEWRAEGYTCQHLPVGFTPNLVRIPKAAEQDIDVCLFAWMTQRRVGLVDALRAAGLKVFASANCYGGGRDNIISRSKVCLNAHHDGRDMFEIVRVSYLMANSKLVVTESSSDEDEYADLYSGLSRAPYRMLVDTCRSYCAPSANVEREKMEQCAFEAIRRRDFTAAVAAALDSAPSPSPTPAVSRPMEFKMERKEAQRSYLSQARGMQPDQRVAKRYLAACASGDMKDFVQWMREHAKGNVMEIGTRDGASTSAFLAGVEQHGGHVYSVDCDASCAKLFEGHPQWTFIHANSTDFPTVTKAMPFELDVLLIDGDHSRAGVINDIEYARQLRPGGLLLLHDIAPESRPSGCNDMSWPGDDVKRVYEELCVVQAAQGWTHEELPGKYGMGVLKKPVSVAKEAARELV